MTPREWILDYIALIMTKFYNVVILFPRWLLFVISGSIASVVINFLHKPSPTPAAQTQNQTIPAQINIVQPSIDATTNSTATSSFTIPTKRKKVKAKSPSTS